MWQGVYVLTDNLFKPFARMSTAPGVNAIPRAEPVCYTLCYRDYGRCTDLCAVPLVSLRCGTGRVGGLGHQCDGTG